MIQYKIQDTRHKTPKVLSTKKILKGISRAVYHLPLYFLPCIGATPVYYTTTLSTTIDGMYDDDDDGTVSDITSSLDESNDLTSKW